MEKGAVGSKIRDLRKRQGVSGKELAERVGISAAAVSKFERGLLRPTDEFIESTISALNLNASEALALREIGALLNSQFQRWSNTAEQITKNQELIGKREQNASQIRSYWNQIIPGLLQADSYIRAVMKSFYDKSDTEVEKIVRARKRRQKILSKKKKSFLFILGESALTTYIDSEQTMSEQKEHLLKIISEEPSVEIRILPLRTFLRRIPMHHFILYDERTVEIEVSKGQVDLWTSEDVDFHIELMNYLVSKSLNASQSKEFINKNM